MANISLASLGGGSPDGVSPTELVAKAVQVAESGGPGIGSRIPVDIAKQYAVDVIVSVVQSVISRYDPIDLVMADERLSHLTDDEICLVADLVDSATATITCSFGECGYDD